MALALFGIRLLEVLFFTGIVGSSVVVLITTVQDMQELFESDEHTPAVDKTQ